MYRETLRGAPSPRSWIDFRRNRRFLLHTGKGYDQRIFDRLLREGWRITVRTRTSDEAVYEVNAPLIGTP